MTREELDTLWFQAMRQSIEDGEVFIRYHFAALVAAAEREACAALVDANAAVCKNNSMLADVLLGTALAIRARGGEAVNEKPEDIEALRQDAERYRWLRDWERGTHDIVPMTGRYCDAPILSEKLDAAIDAAMKEDKP